MRRLRVYVAGPYSANNVMDVLKNIRIGILWSVKLLTLGFAPFTPWTDFQLSLGDTLNQIKIEDIENICNNEILLSCLINVANNNIEILRFFLN
jgi:hypothetical protein